MIDVLFEINNKIYDAIRDLHCYPKRIELGDTKPKMQSLNVPYRNGNLYPIGWMGTEPVFEARTIKVPMKIVSDDPEFSYSEINSILNGRMGKLTTSTNRDYYHLGYFQLGGLKTSGWEWIFDLTMIADPYKYKQRVTKLVHTLDDSAWTATLMNDRMTCYPTIKCSNSSAVTGNINGKSLSISGSGDHVIAIPLVEGKNTIRLSGTSGQKVTISYQEGRL